LRPCRVAIVGRANVGKSSLFNLLVGKRKAVVAPFAGVTRDVLEERINIKHGQIVLMDTGGGELPDPELGGAIDEKLNKAIQEADFLIFMVDVKQGPHPVDKVIYTRIKKSGKPFITVVNKVDNEKLKKESTAFYEIGIEKFIPISVIHKRGINELIEKIVEYATPVQKEEIPEIPVAIIGRPNVGKSSLVNRIIGEDRIIVSEIPGTTRDAVDVIFSYKNHIFRFIDTAGLRRKSRVSKKIEAYSISRTTQAIEEAHICVLLIDAAEGVTRQDQRIAGLVIKKRKTLIVAISKADLLEKEKRRSFTEHIKREFHFLPHIEIIYTSALKGEGINTLLEKIVFFEKKYTSRIPTAQLNKELEKAFVSPLEIKGKPLKIFYATQVETAPPHIVLFTNIEKIEKNIERYIEKRIKKALALEEVPVKLTFKKKR